MTSLELTLLYLAAAVMGVVVCSALRLPAMLGYLMVGVVIGPNALASFGGMSAPAGAQTVSQPSSIGAGATLTQPVSPSEAVAQHSTAREALQAFLALRTNTVPTLGESPRNLELFDRTAQKALDELFAEKRPLSEIAAYTNGVLSEVYHWLPKANRWRLKSYLVSKLDQDHAWHVALPMRFLAYAEQLDALASDHPDTRRSAELLPEAFHASDSFNKNLAVGEALAFERVSRSGAIN